MTRHCVAALCLLSLMSGGCEKPVVNAAVQGSPAGASLDKAAEALPESKTSVTLQGKYVRKIPINGSSPAYITVRQWVFHPDGDKDGTLICVKDGTHCIELVKLEAQLNRPTNDPLGIR